MRLPMTRPTDPAAAAPAVPADRLLRGMHKTLSHDLPNQVVVLQSLLQLLHADDFERLSEDGKEYVQRLISVARKAAGMTRFLKEMGRLHGYQPRPEEVALPALARELKAELVARFPQRPLDFAWAWDVPAVRVDYRPFAQALLELLHGLVEQAPPGRCPVAGASRLTPDGTEIAFHVGRPAAGATRGAADLRNEMLLAREWLAACGADLDPHGPDAGPGFTVLLPAAHD